MERIRRGAENAPAISTVGRGRKRTLPISNSKLAKALTGSKVVKRVKRDQHGQFKVRVSGPRDPGEHQLDENKLFFTQHEEQGDTVARENSAEEEGVDAAGVEHAWADSLFEEAEEVIEGENVGEGNSGGDGDGDSENVGEGEGDLEGEGEDDGKMDMAA